jgi:3',5'-cyclic AMP phosphodiesterase CpdA
MRIAQISDLHVAGGRFDPLLLARAVQEIGEAGPDLLVVAGDLTEDGYPDEQEAAREALAPLEGVRRVVVPGNHDARHVGYLWFEETFGERHTTFRERLGGIDVAVVAIDTSKPDVDEGEVGREHYEEIRAGLAPDAELRVFVCHHHLVPIPATGREANQVRDAGDVLRLLQHCNVDLVLSGHRHVPWVWPIAGMLLVHSGTVSTLRARGFRQPAYNIVDADAERIRVELRVPGGERRSLGDFPRAWPPELSGAGVDVLERPGPGR